MEEKEVVQIPEEQAETNLEVAETPAKAEEKTSDVRAIKIEKLTKDDQPFNEVVDKERVEILGAEKVARRISTISMAAGIVLAVIGIAFFNVNQIVTWIMAIAAIIVVLTSSIVIKRIARPDVKGYILRSNVVIDKYVFSNTVYEDVTYYPDMKIGLDRVSTDGIYKSNVGTASRNVINMTYKNMPFTICELALFKVRTNTKSQTNFVGKYIETTNDLHFENRFVLVNANADEAKRLDIPDGLEDLKCLFSDKGFSVYGPEGSDYTKVIPGSVIRAFRAITLDEYLVNNILVIWAGKSVLYSSYDDKVISLPFYEAIDVKAYESFKKDLEHSVELLAGIKGK